MAGGGSTRAVFLALLGNGFLTITKSVAFLLTRSPAMLSEAIHSFADTANQGLLFIGIKRSNRPADARYHWGYGGERFLFSLLSAIGIFVLGCGVTVYHGVHSLIDPPDITVSWVSYAVLGVALLVDGFVLSAAIREVSAKKGDNSLMHFIRTSSDPTLLAVLFEDFVASVGVIVALIGIGLTQITGESYFDAASSIIIGIMLGLVAAWLGYRNRELILGPAIPKHIEDEVAEYLRQQPSIEAVRGIRTRIFGSEHYAFSADIDYNGKYLGKKHEAWFADQAKNLDEERAADVAGEFGELVLDTLAQEIDRIERELRKRFPQLAFVDLESDENPSTTGEGDEAAPGDDSAASGEANSAAE